MGLCGVLSVTGKWTYQAAENYCGTVGIERFPRLGQARSVWFVWFLSFFAPNEPNEQARLADFFSILLVENLRAAG